MDSRLSSNAPHSSNDKKSKTFVTESGEPNEQQLLLIKMDTLVERIEDQFS